MTGIGPRIAPLDMSEWDDAQRALMAPMVERGTAHNIFRTLLRHRDAFRGFLGWGSHVLSKANTLPPHIRELLILRTAHLCGCAYVWAQHVPIGRRAGLTADQVTAIRGDGHPWSDAERSALDACEDLQHQKCIGDSCWADLCRHFNELQRMDIVFTVGQYTQLAMMANSFGVELDSHLDASSPA